VTVGNKRARNEALVSDMLSVTLLEVPEYLQKGELFHHFKQNESTEAQDDRLLVPADCYKQDDNVHNMCELLWLLRSLRYWVVEELPYSVYDYLTKQLHRPSEELCDIAKSFPAVKVMLSLKDYPTHKHLAVAACHGELRLMTHLRSGGHRWQHTECCDAACAGQLACLRYAYEHGCILSYNSPLCEIECACLNAFCNGHLECFLYAHEHGCQRLCYLHAKDCANTSAPCLHYVLDNPTVSVFPLSLRTIGHAATRLGSVSCMDKARAQGWQISNDHVLFDTALLMGDHVILEHVIKEGCYLRDEAANTLLARGRTDNLMLLLDRGQFLSAASLCQLVQRGEFQMLREMIDRAACATTVSATVAVAKSFQVDILTRALQRGFDRSAEVW
jgi:hypothetical protein